jgi:hypothetical protein
MEHRWENVFAAIGWSVFVLGAVLTIIAGPFSVAVYGAATPYWWTWSAFGTILCIALCGISKELRTRSDERHKS